MAHQTFPAQTSLFRHLVDRLHGIFNHFYLFLLPLFLHTKKAFMHNMHTPPGAASMAPWFMSGEFSKLLSQVPCIGDGFSMGVIGSVAPSLDPWTAMDSPTFITVDLCAFEFLPFLSPGNFVRSQSALRLFTNC